jgi:hypothetical protein
MTQLNRLDFKMKSVGFIIQPYKGPPPRLGLGWPLLKEGRKQAYERAAVRGARFVGGGDGVVGWRGFGGTGPFEGRPPGCARGHATRARIRRQPLKLAAPAWVSPQNPLDPLTAVPDLQGWMAMGYSLASLMRNVPNFRWGYGTGSNPGRRWQVFGPLGRPCCVSSPRGPHRSQPADCLPQPRPAPGGSAQAPDRDTARATPPPFT